MKKFIVTSLILFFGLLSVYSENVYSIGANYTFFTETTTYSNIDTISKMNGVGFDFSYRHFATSEDFESDYVINADDGSFIYSNKPKLNIGFWYGLNINVPLSANIETKENSLFLTKKENNFWSLIVDNIIGATFSINFTRNFFTDISLGPKIGFFYINYENMTNLTFGIASELAGRIYFENSKNPQKKVGIGFGSKVSYDLYSVAQIYFAEEYSKYNILTVTPFISFMLKN